MSEPELKLCPFCGGDATCSNEDKFDYGWQVTCNLCNANSDSFEAKEFAIDHWNERHSEVKDEQFMTYPIERMCKHVWNWTLGSGEPWGEPSNLRNYDAKLVIGKCVNCGEIHDPSNAQIARLTADLAEAKQKNFELECLWRDIDGLTFDLTGYEGEDDSLTVLERYVKDLKSRLEIAEKAVEWMMTNRIHSQGCRGKMLSMITQQDALCTCGLTTLRQQLSDALQSQLREKK